ncbi:MAG: winged helix-turn-helix transcriptional regulator [Candidatus Thorarchaeota archaeon]
MSKRRQKLTDQMLLKALAELGGSGKAPELAKMLKFPVRTIRYRIQRLKEKGFFYQQWPQTLDAKLGLGELGLFLELTEEYRHLPREFLYCFKNFNVHYATYGRYNGYFTAGGFPLERPEIIDTMLQDMRKMNILKDHHRFDTVDFIPIQADLSRYNPTTGWKWNWKDWVTQSEKAIKSGAPSGFNFSWDRKTMEYDHTDIAILAEIKEHGHISSKEISKRVGISDTQVRVRMKRLRDENVLRGSVWILPPSPTSLILYTFVEIDPTNDSAMSCFRYLPFRRDIYMDKPNRFAIRITMNSSDLVGYMKAFETLRTYFDSYFFQTVVNRTVALGGMHSHYQLHNESTNRWEIPMDDYLQEFEKFVKNHS